MKEEYFNKRIERLRAKRLPSCPSNLETNVLRRIRLAEAEIETDFWSWLGTLIPRTSFVTAALTLVVVTSSAVTFTSTTAYAAGVERRVETSRALDLDFVKSIELIDFHKH